MTRIKIKDLPVKEDLSDEEKKKIKGGLKLGGSLGTQTIDKTKPGAENLITEWEQE
jgi:hypothetical protein